MSVSAGEQTGVLTERDLEVSGWVGRLVGASATQIALRFGLGRTQVYRRLRVLQAYGLLEHRRLVIGRPALYVVRGRTLGIASYEHALAVSELVARREVAGARMITEREARGLRAGGVDLDLDGEEIETIRSCRRTPDAMERGAGGLIAYEVELSAKGRTRRERIITDYAASEYVAVRWLVPNARLGELIRNTIDTYGVARFMEVATHEGASA